ncbi:MAG: hypothetical protein FJ144_14950 [Deltaproteobacteria bacterium]|nr:hypothetical protein [Deltaproteobacteria bacterium]
MASKSVRSFLARLAFAGCAFGLAACGGDGEEGLGGGAPSAAISMTVVNQMPMPQPCMGPSLTFFEGTTPVDIPNQGSKTVQVSQLFGAYQIGFQVNGWYWRTCSSPGVCPNTNNCQNPDNAGQVAVQIAADCSSATLLQNWDDFTCDKMVPNASNAVSVALQSANPCTVVISGTSTLLQPTADCCSCSSCTASQTPTGQTLHCQ